MLFFSGTHHSFLDFFFAQAAELSEGASTDARQIVADEVLLVQALCLLLERGGRPVQMALGDQKLLHTCFKTLRQGQRDLVAATMRLLDMCTQIQDMMRGPIVEGVCLYHLIALMTHQQQDMLQTPDQLQLGLGILARAMQSHGTVVAQFVRFGGLLSTLLLFTGAVTSHEVTPIPLYRTLHLLPLKSGICRPCVCPFHAGTPSFCGAMSVFGQ